MENQSFYKSNFKDLHSLYEGKKYKECLTNANILGKDLLIKLIEANGPMGELYLCDLKHITMVTTECIKKIHCHNCVARHLAKVFTLFHQLKQDTRLSLGLRQQCGVFLNELLSLRPLSENLHLLPQDKQKRRHHLILA